ncbi:MAG: hypothetical protein HY332_14600 [Chloroflexi bacterium]|nr:hypothetical protein [Chloroflexota bacterium]
MSAASNRVPTTDDWRLTTERGEMATVQGTKQLVPHNTIDPQVFLDSVKAQGVRSEARVLRIGETLVLGR